MPRRCATPRRAPVLVASPRAREALRSAGDVVLDALVLSGDDERELRWSDESAARPRLRVETAGGDGGRWSGESEGRWEAAPLSGPVRDAYGCGDSFVAGVTLGLAEGRGMEAAARLGAELGARALTRAGAP